jgi:hypothetical protein
MQPPNLADLLKTQPLAFFDYFNDFEVEFLCSLGQVEKEFVNVF